MPRWARTRRGWHPALSLHPCFRPLPCAPPVRLRTGAVVPAPVHCLRLRCTCRCTARGSLCDGFWKAASGVGAPRPPPHLVDPSRHGRYLCPRCGCHRKTIAPADWPEACTAGVAAAVRRRSGEHFVGLAHCGFSRGGSAPATVNPRRPPRYPPVPAPTLRCRRSRECRECPRHSAFTTSVTRRPSVSTAVNLNAASTVKRGVDWQQLKRKVVPCIGDISHQPESDHCGASGLAGASRSAWYTASASVSTPARHQEDWRRRKTSSLDPERLVVVTARRQI